MCVKLNNTVGLYFMSHKGVRQGDPLSPFLFNIVAECLCKMVLVAQSNNLVVGLAPDLINNGVAILQYANDTVLCFEHYIDKALNMKLFLYMFDLMPGLKINFQKCEILCVRGDDEILKTYADIFNCQIGHFPMKYLGWLWVFHICVLRIGSCWKRSLLVNVDLAGKHCFFWWPSGVAQCKPV